MKVCMVNYFIKNLKVLILHLRIYKLLQMENMVNGIVCILNLQKKQEKKVLRILQNYLKILQKLKKTMNIVL